MEKEEIRILGGGQIGTAIEELAGAGMGTYVVDLKFARLDGKDFNPSSGDINPYRGQSHKIIHVCIPWGDTFVGAVLGQITSETEMIIIHSTVPVGTTDRINKVIGRELAVHSPVRGVHPDLAEGIRKFAKYVGTEEAALKSKVSEHLCDLGCEDVVVGFTSRETELAKILSTTYYGWNIVFEKEVNRICKQMEVDPDVVYRHWNSTYNEGYRELGKDNVVRPVLEHMEGQIGGHCVTGNLDLLDNFITRTIKERNETY